MKISFGIWLLIFPAIAFSQAQDKHHYQKDFSKEEFAQRRMAVLNAIGNNSVAVIQGASGLPGFSVFRQTNSFYYLTGIETPHAYLLMNGRNKTATLYLPHRDEGTENNQGKVLSAEDRDLVIQLTGIEQVKGYEFL